MALPPPCGIGVEGATHASSPSLQVQEQEPEESTFECKNQRNQPLSDHLDAAVEAVVNEMGVTNKVSKSGEVYSLIISGGLRLEEWIERIRKPSKPPFLRGM
eukprot:scaffold58406_cov43-Cyclotella_meneghiniana.AAC.1